MRSLFAIIAAGLLTACASQAPAPAPQAAAAPAEKKAPQCWSGDHSKFMDVGTRTTIAGVAVECKLTADSKAAQWMGSKH